MTTMQNIPGATQQHAGAAGQYNADIRGQLPEETAPRAWTGCVGHLGLPGVGSHRHGVRPSSIHRLPVNLSGCATARNGTAWRDRTTHCYRTDASTRGVML